MDGNLGSGAFPPVRIKLLLSRAAFIPAGTRCSAHSAFGFSRVESGVRNDQNGTSGWTGWVGKMTEGGSLMGGMGRWEVVSELAGVVVVVEAEEAGVAGLGAVEAVGVAFLTGRSKNPLRMASDLLSERNEGKRCTHRRKLGDLTLGLQVSIGPVRRARPPRSFATEPGRVPKARD